MDGLVKRLSQKRKIPFILSRGVTEIKRLSDDKLPTDEIQKYISLSGGFSSICFIRWVADHEVIEELHASTLRIGEKQFRELDQMRQRGRLKSARFFISSMMTDLDGGVSKKYNYAKRFQQVCKDAGWRNIVVNNHSKIILMRTATAHYVLETSSNLNENPKIEQYSFENSAELYDFYNDFFNALEAANQN